MALTNEQILGGIETGYRLDDHNNIILDNEYGEIIIPLDKLTPVEVLFLKYVYYQQIEKRHSLVNLGLGKPSKTE